jgi:hypothetical protein
VVFSAENLAGLLHPAADPGVRRVRGSSSRPLRGVAYEPPRREHPSKLCSSPAAAFPIPLGEDLPSCRLSRQHKSEDLRTTSSFDGLATVDGLLEVRSFAFFDFRALGHRSSLLSHRPVSSPVRAWLPWVSAPARARLPASLGLRGFSPNLSAGSEAPGGLLTFLGLGGGPLLGCKHPSRGGPGRV